MKIKAGEIVTFNDLPDAAQFEVVSVDGFNMEVREAGTDYRTQSSDTSLVVRVIKSNR